MIKRLAIAAILFLGLAQGTFAQTNTVQGAYNSVTTNLPDNTGGAITPYLLRKTLNYIIGVFPSTTNTTLSLTSFGAKCDGATDDTTAIQAWLSKLASGVNLTAPAGKCLFSSGLTAPFSNNYALGGAGNGATIFQYIGTSNNIDLLTISDTTHGGERGASISNFSIRSATVMTGGFAIHAHGLFNSFFSNVWADNVNSEDSTTKGNLWGGVWFDGVGGVSYINPYVYSQQGGGDGIRVNSALGGTAGLYLVDGNLGGFPGGFANDVHVAGGFGGFDCDGTNIATGGNGILVDNAVVASANREVDIGSTCAVDSSVNNGVLVNDTLSSGGTIDIGGWVASTTAGPGIRIQAWGAGDVEFRGHKIYNSCGPGVWIDDANAHVTFSSATVINNNWNGSIGGSCTTWQAANPTLNYGVYASVSTFNMTGSPSIFNSPFTVNANTHMASLTSSGYGLTYSFPQTAGLGLFGAAGLAQSINFGNPGAAQWQIGNDGSQIFSIWDIQNSAIKWLQLSTGGAAVLGEGDTSTLTVLGGQTIKVTGAGATAALTLNETNAGAGGRPDNIYLDDNGTQEWVITKDSGNLFRVLDVQAAFASAITISTGGSITIGETTSSVIAVPGILNVVNGYKANGTAGVSCAAASVSLTTLVVTNGLVTHC